MIVSVISPKGGAGKTSIAVSIALSLKKKVLLVDCDVECPNVAIYLNPEEKVYSIDNYREVPIIDKSRCTKCYSCTSCPYGAIIIGRDGYPEIDSSSCSSCRICFYKCKRNAILLSKRKSGSVSFYRKGNISVLEGRICEGERYVERVVEVLLSTARFLEGSFDLVLIDSPPGFGCTVLKIIDISDAVILVEEDSPFGRISVERIESFIKKKYVKVVNKVRKSKGLEFEIPYSEKLPLNVGGVCKWLEGLLSAQEREEREKQR